MQDDSFGTAHPSIREVLIVESVIENINEEKRISDKRGFCQHCIAAVKYLQYDGKS
jgi:hypothetical protein